MSRSCFLLLIGFGLLGRDGGVDALPAIGCDNYPSGNSYLWSSDCAEVASALEKLPGVNTNVYCDSDLYTGTESTCVPVARTLNAIPGVSGVDCAGGGYLIVPAGASACSTAAGQLNAHLAEPCSKGQYFDSSFNCQACPANTFQTSPSHRTTTCPSTQPTCGIGEKISADTKSAQRTCSTCADNTFQDDVDHRTTTCATQPTCGKGQQYVESTTDERTCSPCPPFTFQPSDSHYDTECATADVSTCSDAGNFDFTTGTCACNTNDPSVGGIGPACAHTNAETCNDAGVAQADGSCVCNTNDPSVGGIGPACAHTNALNCNNVGTAQPDGSCVCDGPVTGLGKTCSEISNALNCNGQATVKPDGTCAPPCNTTGGYTGDRCDECFTDTHDLIEKGTVSRIAFCADLADPTTCDSPETTPIVQCVAKGITAICDPGERAVNRECVLCDADTYADGTRTDGTNDGGIRVQCKACPSNTITQQLNASSLNDCVARCELGEYSANATCTACGNNNFADGTDTSGAPDNGRRTACKTCPEGSSNKDLVGSPSITECVCANNAPAREYFYISEADKACNECPPNEISVAGEATSAADCFAKYQTVGDGSQRFCYGSGIDSRSNSSNVDTLAFALARVGTRKTTDFDEPWQSCEEAKKILKPDYKFIHPANLSCNSFKDGTCWDKTARGDAQLPFGCVMNSATQEIMYFSEEDANNYYDGFAYVPVCERYVCPDNPDGDTERPVPLTEAAILLDTSSIPECRLSAVSVDAYNDEATKENNTVFIPIAVGLSILCMLLAACLTRDNVKWQWVIFGVGMRTFDCQTDWGFYIINVRNKGFETIYTDGLIAGTASVGKVFKASLSGFQTASLAICIVGMLLTPLDVWGNRQRALGNPSLAMTISIVILLLEDVPQLLFNIKFMYAMGSSDTVSILSLAASIGNILYNVGLILYELCGGYTPGLPACCKSNREAELEELARSALEREADLARQLEALERKIERSEGKRVDNVVHNPAFSKSTNPAKNPADNATKVASVKASIKGFSASDVGKPCIVVGVGSGTIRFVGLHAEKNDARIGVEMNKPKGKNNGTVNGHKYFECPDGFGLLTIPSHVKHTTGSRKGNAKVTSHGTDEYLDVGGAAAAGSHA